MKFEASVKKDKKAGNALGKSLQKEGHACKQNKQCDKNHPIQNTKIHILSFRNVKEVKY